LHVPVGTSGLYRSTEGWELFRSIVETPYVANTSPVSPSAIDVSTSGSLLRINSPLSETITLYSLTGALLYQSSKPAGITTINISHLPCGVIIVSGSSGWVRKIVR
jgi:hypothetical protein